MSVTVQTSPQLRMVRELPAGDKVTGFYLLAKLETRQKKDGAPYLNLQLKDSTAHLEARFWDNFAEFQNSVQVGDVVKVEGIVDRYRDLPQLILTRARKATEQEVPDRRAFLPHSVLSAEDARKQLTEFIASLEHPHLRQLLERVFSEDGVLSAFLEAAGGKLWHHATIGGLAEHTLSLARLADQVAALYPALNRDLLMSGALLHDIGKVFELGADTTIDYTTEGRLLGHITQGALLLEREIGQIEDFPAEVRRQLLHLLLSHQGDGMMGSPVKPMTREALALHYCDELDSRLDAFERVRAGTPEGQVFSDWVRLMERFFYFGSVDENNDTGGGNV